MSKQKTAIIEESEAEAAITLGEVIHADRIRPVGTFMLVRKCERPQPALIILPDLVREDTNFVEVLAVGPKCKHFTPEHIGKTVQCPDFADGMHCLGGEFWMVKELLIQPVVYE
jgi:hypothetical protein